MRALDDFYDKNYQEFVPLRTKVRNAILIYSPNLYIPRIVRFFAQR